MNRIIFSILTLCLVTTSVFAKKKVKHEEERVPGSPSIHVNSFDQEISYPLGGLFIENEYHLLYASHTKTEKSNVWSASIASSKDLMLWKKQEIGGAPVIIVPDSVETEFQGCFITDSKTVSGEGAQNWYIFYAENESKIRVSQSVDHGKSWTDISSNFLFNIQGGGTIKNPHVTFDPNSSTWVMTLFRENSGLLEYYNSTNLKEWTKKGASPEVNPKAHLEYLAGDKQWIMVYGREYVLGNLTKNIFTPESSKMTYDYGQGFLDFHIVNKADSALAVGFVNNQNTSRGGIIGGITYPKIVTVQTDNSNKYLKSEFHKTALTYFDDVPVIKENKVIYPGLRNKVLTTFRSESYLLDAKFSAKTSDSFGFLVQGRRDKRGKEVAFLTKTNSFQTIAGTMPIVNEHGSINVKMLVDKNMVSIIAENGKYNLTFYTHHDPNGKQIFFYSKGGEFAIDQLKVWYERFGR